MMNGRVRATHVAACFTFSVVARRRKRQNDLVPPKTGTIWPDRSTENAALGKTIGASRLRPRARSLAART